MIGNTTNDEKNYIYYGDFDWINYINENPELKNLYKKKDEIYSYYIKEQQQKNKLVYFTINKKREEIDFFENYYTINDLNVSFDDFQWKSYLSLNIDLEKSGINTREKAWNHWIKYGKNEERAFSIINNTNIHNGRFGNIFFINMFMHFISIKFDLKCNYKYNNKFNRLGIYFNTGKKIYNKNLLVNEKNFIELLEEPIENSNIIINNDIWFHDNYFCLIIQEHFNKIEVKNKIIESNLYKKRYSNNNDLFIHIRLGDIKHVTESLLPFYEKMLSTLKYDNCYISSDTINCDFCMNLIKKYKLIILDGNEEEIIMFGSTCKHIVLTGGTFSWLIGFFAFYSDNIYYPKFKNMWFGDIFSFSNWICITDF